MPNMYRAPAGTPLPPGHTHNDPCPGGRHWERGRKYPPTPGSQIDLLHAVAVHECGHGAMAVALGLRTRWMWIRQNWRGHAEGGTEIACEEFTPEQRRQILLLLVGGMQATAIWMQRTHNWPARSALRFGASSACADQKMFRAEVRGTNYTLARALSEADTILRARWRTIERVSGLLVARRKLAAAKVA